MLGVLKSFVDLENTLKLQDSGILVGRKHTSQVAIVQGPLVDKHLFEKGIPVT